jgi:hypothetical protein
MIKGGAQNFPKPLRQRKIRLTSPIRWRDYDYELSTSAIRIWGEKRGERRSQRRQRMRPKKSEEETTYEWRGVLTRWRTNFFFLLLLESARTAHRCRGIQITKETKDHLADKERKTHINSEQQGPVSQKNCLAKPKFWFSKTGNRLTRILQSITRANAQTWCPFPVFCYHKSL